MNNISWKKLGRWMNFLSGIGGVIAGATTIISGHPEIGYPLIMAGVSKIVGHEALQQEVKGLKKDIVNSQPTVDNNTTQ